MIPTRDLQVGDQVRVADGGFERIETFGHKSVSIKVNYLEISFIGGSLELSPDHMVFVESEGFKAASEVIPGDNLRSLLGDDIIVVDRIGQLTNLGEFAPFTQSGIIMVNRVVASNYVTLPIKLFGYKVASGHWLAHVSQAPCRLALRMSWWTNESITADGISTNIPIEFTQWLLEQNEIVFAILFIPTFVMAYMTYGLEHVVRFVFPY